LKVDPLSKDSLIKECEYYCYICKKRTFNGLFMKFVEEKNPVWVCHLCKKEIQNMTTEDLKKIKSDGVRMEPKKLTENIIDNILIAININEIRKLCFRYNDGDFCLKDFLKELKYYSWMSRYYSEYDLVRKEILMTCFDIWDRCFCESSTDHDIDDEDLNNYINLIENSLKNGGIIDGFDLPNDAMDLLERIIRGFEKRGIIKDIKDRMKIE